MNMVDDHGTNVRGAGKTTTPWREATSAGAVASVVGLGSVLVAAGQVIVPPIVLGVLFALTAVALRRTRGRWPLFVGLALPVIAIAGNAPFIAGDLSHPDSFASFAPAVVILLSTIATFASAALALRRARFSPRPLAVGAVGLGLVAIVASGVISASLSDDERQPGDVEVVARDVEYPAEVDATAGEVGIFLENDDPIRHSFIIEGTAVDQELPGRTDRRVTVNLEPGRYRFYCDVAGHENMEGTLIVE